MGNITFAFRCMRPFVFLVPVCLMNLLMFISMDFVKHSEKDMFRQVDPLLISPAETGINQV